MRTALDHTMLAYAKARGRVRLESGIIVTLCSWGTRTSPDACRVRDAANHRWDEPKICIIELVETVT